MSLHHSPLPNLPPTNTQQLVCDAGIGVGPYWLSNDGIGTSPSLPYPTLLLS